MELLSQSIVGLLYIGGRGILAYSKDLVWILSRLKVARCVECLWLDVRKMYDASKYDSCQRTLLGDDLRRALAEAAKSLRAFCLAVHDV